ncbi:MAG: copper chaperone PCu(A)C [Neisseria sp.]|nr:copper chaperone PCu(A)C [Neisseria sp.]
MKKTVLTLAAALLCHSAFAAGIQAQNAWARETVAGMSMGGVFLQLDNQSGKDDVLQSVETPAAKKAEIHEHIHEDGMMKMREKTGGLPLAKGQTLELKPGGYHIMLMGLKQELKAGNSFPVTLKFKRSGKQTVNVTVQSNARGANAHSHHGHQHGHEHQH